MSWPTDVSTPFGEPIEEIHLPFAPLIAVVAQVRFPPIVSISREDFIGTFQERIRTDYPVLRTDQEVNIVVTPEGITSGGEPTTVWRFLDHPTEPKWKVSLAPSFLALDTSQYGTRSDFINRFRTVLVAMLETLNPASSDRIGVRYINRIPLNHLDETLTELVRPEVLGVINAEFGEGADLLYSISDTQYQIGNAILRGRWGHVPPGAQMDPFHGQAIDHPAWLLDLDMYDATANPFDTSNLVSIVEEFSEHIYRFFRWTVSPALLRHYGGKVD